MSTKLIYHIRAFLRVCLFFLTVLFFFAQSIIAGLALREKERRRNFFVRITSRWANIGNFIQGLRPTYKIHPDVDFKKGYLVVCNHVGYSDIMMIAAKLTGLFVTSNEIKETPLLGWICERAGCLFVERRKSKRSKEGREQELFEIADAIKHKHNVIIFPEATSTNGDTIKEFKPGLLQVAIDNEFAILPVTINYKEIDGSPDIRANRDKVFWYGDMTFFDHFWTFLGLDHVKAEVTIDQPIPIKATNNKAEVAELARQAVLRNYLPLASSSTATAGSDCEIDNRIHCN